MSFQHPHRGFALGAAILAIPLVVASLSGCTAGRASDGSATSGSSSVVVGFKHEFNTMDPLHADYAQTNMVDNIVYEPLVQFDAANDNKMVGMLATANRVSPDAKSIEFTLRENVVFHDGTPFTAKDVKFSLDRYVRLGQGIASQLAGYKSTTIVDDSHVVVNLSAPNAFFISGLADVYIMEAAAVSAHAGTDDSQGWLQSHEAGTGPYEGSSTSSPDGTTATRFDKYWNFDATRPKQLVFRRIDESATEHDELKAGNIDVALGLTASDAESLKGTSGLAVNFVKTPGQTELFFNNSTGPTADPKIREGLKLAFDYAGGYSRILAGEGTISNGILSPAFTCLPAPTPSVQDKAKAKQLLAGLGSTSLDLRYQSVDDTQTQLATLFQSNLKDLGVNINLVPIAFPDYLKTLSSPSTIPSLMLLNDYIMTSDPGAGLDKLYNSANIGSTNKGAYKNAKVDALLDQARVTTDLAQRCTQYKQVETQVESDSAAAYMYQVAFPVGYRSDLKGITASWSATPISFQTLRLG
ncbi:MULTISPECIES: ABC transporter substrate-binding protein [Arthrobacter]|uniref:ABC transporter substrate-binding protein n=1 Tax=Arthrobacter terricola TaxID=2547396 RepID=A0A4R5KBU4_9MICC|nr:MULTISPECIES: ABC transporter substrate-binding protein [Arthrobacter]MBT8161803.1 ABC transporter substrate-binding protein [Arthrobacter sp. GN70]TDF92641.1 ABC transporter substrate-binding protein [Arthrobacter terricola]